jgi:hypothetical protein
MTLQDVFESCAHTVFSYSIGRVVYRQPFFATGTFSPSTRAALYHFTDSA